jgi:ABC-type branched-subunit amino acid transport system ATPase component/branched-subunit amino acid ABC-type transport system permease component
MSEVLIFVVTGLTAGAVYALAGVGLVLTYRTSGVFNFAHGALATVAAYVFYTLLVTHGLPSGLAAAIAVLGLGPVMGLAMEILARRLIRASLAAMVGATVGVLLVIAAGVSLLYGTLLVRNVPEFLGTGTIRIAGTPVQWSGIWTFVIGVAATLALSQLLRRTRTGLAMRAVVDDPELLDAAGISPVLTRRVAWVLGATFAAGSGVLFAPVLPLDPVGLSFLVIAAFGAAAIGGFRNLPLTFIGGLLIGVLASLATRYLTSGILVGVAPSLPFLVLFVVLLVFPKSRATRITLPITRTSPSRSTPIALTAGIGIPVVCFLAFVPAFANLHINDWTTALGTAIVLLSLGLLTRLAGQVSLCHVTFMAIGGAAFSHLVTGAGLPWLPALLLACAVAVPVGAVLAIPAIRLSGLYLALATFGFGLLVEYIFYTQSYMFGTNGVGLTASRPDLGFLHLSGDKAFYYLVLVMTVLVAGLVLVIERSRLGRLLRGLSEAPITLETSGAAQNVTRVLVFCLAAFLAALGGALIAMSNGVITADSYTPLTSLVLLVLVVAIPVGMPWGAVIGAFLFVLIPSYFPSGHISSELQVIFGAAAVTAVFVPERVREASAAVVGGLDGVFRRRPPAAPHPARQAALPVAQPASAPRPGVALELSGVSVRFGGVKAVNDVTISVLPGQITGLIGPNGAGKTTIFNACSGLLRPSSGSLMLGGRPISHLGVAARARTGLGRTFQKMDLFESLSVRDNVALGAEAGMAGRNPLSHLRGTRAGRRRIDEATADALTMVGIDSMAETPVHRLSTGQRRLVDLARCLSGGCSVLLLDEPSSGLDERETERLGIALEHLAGERGVGILLVEHDLPLVLSLCTTIYVLDFGELLFAGTPVEVIESPTVRAAYLGDSADRASDHVEPGAARIA